MGRESPYGWLEERKKAINNMLEQGKDMSEIYDMFPPFGPQGDGRKHRWGHSGETKGAIQIRRRKLGKTKDKGETMEEVEQYNPKGETLEEANQYCTKGETWEKPGETLGEVEKVESIQLEGESQEKVVDK